MLYKTRGIVIGSTKFKETSIIAKILTEEFGLQSYIVNGVRSSKGHTKIALYQPMVLLEMVVYKSEGKSIQRISECKCEYPFKSIASDMYKSSVALFWAELLKKTITEEGLVEMEKFNFIREQLLHLDGLSKGVENCPLNFGIGLTRYLGFEIENAEMVLGEYGLSEFSNPEIYSFFNAIIEGGDVPASNHGLRNKALTCLINYYKLHLDGFGKLKSMEILRQLYS